MATEPGPDTDHEALVAQLETENIAFVDGLNATIADIVENNAHLDY